MASVIVAGDVSGSCTLQAPSAAGSTVLTLPVIATDTLAGIAATQTLTNKTLVAPALGTPASGVLTNCTGVAKAALPAGSVLQVVSTTLTTSSTSTSTSDITIMSASITPRSASNTILVMYNLSCGATDSIQATVYRGASAICLNTSSPSLRNTTSALVSYDTGNMFTQSQQFLDSPATTSSTTYTVKGNCNTGTFAVNRRTLDAQWGCTSTITLMEIQG